MRSGSARLLTILLLSALALPAPRMAVWLVASAASAEFPSGRHEPQARGRNRVPSPIRATVAAASARLDSGPDSATAVRGPGMRIACPPVPPSARPRPAFAAPAEGSRPLRC